MGVREVALDVVVERLAAECPAFEAEFREVMALSVPDVAATGAGPVLGAGSIVK